MYPQINTTLRLHGMGVYYGNLETVGHSLGRLLLDLLQQTWNPLSVRYLRSGKSYIPGVMFCPVVRSFCRHSVQDTRNGDRGRVLSFYSTIYGYICVFPVSTSLFFPKKVPKHCDNFKKKLFQMDVQSLGTFVLGTKESYKKSNTKGS